MGSTGGRVRVGTGWVEWDTGCKDLVVLETGTIRAIYHIEHRGRGLESPVRDETGTLGVEYWWYVVTTVHRVVRTY